MTRCALLFALAFVACKSRSSTAPAIVVKQDATAVDAQTDHSLVSTVQRLRAEKKLPALAAAAWVDGKLVEDVAVGLRKANDPTHPVTTSDRWHLGSNTKAMTAMLVGIYVDRGTLHWDDTLGKLFEKVHAGYANVTLAQLLRHNSGASQDPPPKLWEHLAAGTPSDARGKFVRDILGAKPPHAATKFEYSNTNYMIAGVVLERATKKSWEDLMRDELFTPLGMTSCGFGAPGSAAVDQPWGHNASGPIEPGPAADNPPGLGPAGTVHCSLADYGKFLVLFTGHGPPIVKPETLAQMLVPNADGYAAGWLVAGKLLVHNGSNTLWMMSAAVSPAAKRVLVLATNTADMTLENNLLATFLTYTPP